MRFVAVEIDHALPGREGDYQQMRKLINEQEQKAAAAPVVVYEAYEGAPRWTYLVLRLARHRPN